MLQQRRGAVGPAMHHGGPQPRPGQNKPRVQIHIQGRPWILRHSRATCRKVGEHFSRLPHQYSGSGHSRHQRCIGPYAASLVHAQLLDHPFSGIYLTDGQQVQNQLHVARFGWFNIESEEEFWNLERLAAAQGRTARGALRINPDISSRGTHRKTLTGKKETKFGVDIERAAELFEQASGASHARLTGLHLHIGSPILSPQPYVEAIGKALALIEKVRGGGVLVDTLDIGGGFAAFYEGHEAPAAVDYAAAIVPLLQGRSLRIILEPGRSISCNAGILLTRVQYTKRGGRRKFVIVDAAMNDLIRPTLYESYHFIWPANPGPAREPANRLSTLRMSGDEQVDVVGPVCESGDYLARDRWLPAVKRGDLVAVFSAGAYGFTMSSQYNARPRAAEVLVEGGHWRLIRRRETYQDLIAGEL